MTGVARQWQTADGSDPFRHCPELRGLITDPLASFFRNFKPADVDDTMAAMGREPGWRYSDEERDAMLQVALEKLRGRDLWVFGYGSLIWDPGFLFEEVRHAWVPGYQRRFILWETGGRGTPERPAVMAALDRGAGCDGLAFRIAAQRLEQELDVVWRRERIAPAYLDRFVDAETAAGTVRALTFVADHDAENIRPELEFADQVEALATAKGMLGSNIDYIVNLKEHFDAIGIADDEVDRLCAAALDRAGGT